jgi:molecular chaperone DnaK
MTKLKAIGIDLGTTNSAVAWADAAGHTTMIPNTEGELLTPSVVLFDDNEVVVGKEARTATISNPERVAVWVKRDMGAPVYSRAIRGEYLPPSVIQSCILRKLKTDVVHALGPDCRVVITVPAYFDEPRRKATADAGEMAGLMVLDIVNEPTAGALAFGEVLGYLSPTLAPREQMNVLIYDLGGGTFDVTLLRLSPGNIQTIATDGDVHLGGYDWDLRLFDHAADAFKRVHGKDPRDDPRSVARLFNTVIEAKHSLSARLQTIVRVEHAGQSVDVPITRAEFEELTADLMERTAYTTRQVLGAAKMLWSDVSRILLVGGSTRMPAVPRMLQNMTGITPDHLVNPDEAVARGAALYADYLLMKQAGEAGPAFEVVNVNSHSLGVEGIEPETLRKKNYILIPRNTPLPAKICYRFMTKSDGQRSIVVQVLEGESPQPSECAALGRTVIRDMPTGLPKGWPVEVTFEYGTNGRLTVQAVVPGTQRKIKLEVEREGGLSDNGIARWKEAVSSSAGFEAFHAAQPHESESPGSAVAHQPPASPLPPPSDLSAIQVPNDAMVDEDSAVIRLDENALDATPPAPVALPTEAELIQAGMPPWVFRFLVPGLAVMGGLLLGVVLLVCVRGCGS